MDELNHIIAHGEQFLIENLPQLLRHSSA